MRYRTISINLFVPAHARENARTRRHIIFIYAHASSAINIVLYWNLEGSDLKNRKTYYVLISTIYKKYKIPNK